MPALRTKVKGIKYGTMASYDQIRDKDPDMLYFITDKGLLYRGNSIVVPKNFVHVQQRGDDGYRFTVETYGNGGQQGNTLTFDVYTMSAFDAIVATLTNAISTHAGVNAASRRIGHVVLSDDTNDTTHDADWAMDDTHTEAYAATPKAVALALAAANSYTDQQIAAIAGAMVFKGTIGAAAEYTASATYHQGDYCEHDGSLYRCTSTEDVNGQWDPTQWVQVQRTVATLPATYAVGWTYRVVAPGNYAGAPCEVGDMLICVSDSAQGQQQAANDDWTVAQSNIDGAVTSEQDLPSDTLVVGNGGKTVKKLNQGSTGNFLKQGPNGPVWGEATPSDIGNAVSIATSQSNGRFISANLFNLKNTQGSIVALTFDADVPANATLKLGINGSFVNIVHANANIAAGVIMQGDTATLVYDTSTGTNRWVLLAVDRQAPSSLQGFYNNLIMRGTCNSTTSPLVADIVAGSAQGMQVSIRFTYDVPANATLKLNSDEAAPHAIMHRGAAIAAYAIRAGDTATLVYDASSGTGLWHLTGIDRPFDATPTSGSHSLVDSDAVYNAIENATLYWEEM